MSKVITRSEHFVEIDEVEYEIRLDPDRGTDIEHRKLEDGRMVIGYLMQDSDCANPLEDCDGMGDIHSFSSRHRNSINQSECNSLIDDHKIMAVMLSYFEHGQCKWGVAGSMSGMPDFCWDGVQYAGLWTPDKCCIDEILHRAPVYSAGQIVELRGPTPYRATIKSKSESFKHWHEAFDWLRKQTKRKKPTKQGIIRASEELAAQACEQYTSWCNGDCYGVVVVTCNADGSMIDSDECWGHIGHEYAEQTLKEQMAAVK